MKKVLALVLAVIMVCTMAMAATVSPAIGTSGSASVTPSTTKYDIVPGGTNYYVALKDKNLYFKDNKFVPEKNKIGIDYAAGSDLVASTGWVKIAKTTQNLDKGIVCGTDDTVAYQYQIVLKNDLTRVADGKSFDFSISKITLNATGWEPQTVWEADEDAGDVIKADVGYEVVNIDVTVTSASGLTPPTFADGKINKIASIIKDGSTPLDSATMKINGTSDTATGKTYAKGTLNKGAAFYVVKDTDMPAFVDGDLAKTGTLAPTAAKIVNNYNLPMAGVLEQTDVNAAKLYKVYAKGIDGKVSSVAATLDNGVLKFNVPALSTVIVTTDVLTVTGTSSTAGTTTPGSTTNPGTGANDVVGVAAALAVVALVSGAAISLKK